MADIEKKLRPFYVTVDIFTAPCNQAKPELWTGNEIDGSKRESIYSLDEHELLYEAYDADGNLCAKGTTTEKEIGNWGMAGWEAAIEYHENDTGATQIRCYDRKTGKHKFSN